MILADVEIGGRRVDVRLAAGVIADIGPVGADRDEEVIDGSGGALLPGLHDHHVHVLATASARTSVDCGPHAVDGAESLGRALRAAAGEWVRGTGYHESVAGDLDRDLLDQLIPDRPVRVQHRSGALWMLNSTAIDRVEHVLDDSPDVERDASGRPTGRLWRYDSRLRPALPSSAPDLTGLARTLTGYGITGVTDATPDLDTEAIGLLAGLGLPQTLLGAPDGVPLPHGLTRGPRKLLLRDHDLPTFDELAAIVAGSHVLGRSVAVHCVSRESLVLTLAVLEEVGAHPGDRIEHAAVVPAGVEAWMAQLGVSVVTQPDFLRSRGDQYSIDVSADDLTCLYPHASLIAAGVRVTASSDAPYGELDPWRVIRSAVERTAVSGLVLGAHERVSAATALAGYLSRADDPGGPARRIVTGAPADLCLLDAPLAEVLADPHSRRVRATIMTGQIVSRS